MWFRSERNLCRWTFFCKYYFSPASLSNFFSSILLAHLPSTRLSCARQRLFVTGRYAMGTCWHQKHDWIITPKWTNRFGRYCFNGKLTTHDVLFLDAASVALQPKLAAHVYLLHRYFLVFTFVSARGQAQQAKIVTAASTYGRIEVLHKTHLFANHCMRGPLAFFPLLSANYALFELCHLI